MCLNRGESPCGIATFGGENQVYVVRPYIQRVEDESERSARFPNCGVEHQPLVLGKDNLSGTHPTARGTLDTSIRCMTPLAVAVSALVHPAAFIAGEPGSIGAPGEE